MSLRHPFGRAEEDGTVFVTTPQGEVKVGQYGAELGDAAAGLAFFARRFDDLVADIELTLTRLKDGKAAPDAAQVVADKVSATLASPNCVGDMGVLETKLVELKAAADSRREQLTAAKAEAKAKALAKREELTIAAEKLADSNAWKVTGETFKTMLDEWKKIPTSDRAREQELWKRFSQARSSFDKARRAHFATLDAARATAMKGKQDLVAKAESLAESLDWASTSIAFRELMNEWKSLPRAGRNEEDKLWATFKAAQDKFFDARNAANSARDGEFAENLAAKLALLEEVEKLVPVKDLDATKASLRSLQEKWEKIGHVPRGDKEKIDRRMRAVEDAVRQVEQELWHRSKPEVKDRATGLISSFAASIEKLDAQIASAKAAGKDSDVKKLEASRAQAVALLEAAQASAADLI